MAFQGIPVLNYHAIDNTGNMLPSRNVSVSLTAFKEQMEWLYNEGYKTVTDTELKALLIEGKSPTGKMVLITFDDGYYSLYKYALEILSGYGFTATLFLSTSFIGNPYEQGDFDFVKHDHQLTWDEIKKLHAAGWSVQSHGYNHKRLNSLSVEEIIKEVTLSKSIIEQNLGTQVHSFAFPYGIYTNAVIQQLKVAGYTFAYSVHSGKMFSRSNKFRLPRIEINNMDTMDSFKTKTLTGYISKQHGARSKIRDIIYVNAALKDLIERWTPMFGFGNH